MTTTKMPVLRTKNSIDTINLNTTNNSTTNITLTFPALHMNNNVTIYNLDGSVNSNFNVSFPIELTMDNVTFSRITLDDAQFNYEVFYTEKINTYPNSVEYQNALSQSYMNVTTIPYTAPPVFAFGSINFSSAVHDDNGNTSAYRVPITVSNSQTTATGTNFQQLISFTPSSLSSYINPNCENIFFTESNLNLLDSWIENATSSTSSGSVNIWVKIPNINANSNITIYMYINSTTTTSALSTNHTGAQPNYTSTYGEYDNGNNVFNFYDNFAGTTLSSKWTVVGSGGTVDNGLSLSMSSGSSGDYVIYSTSTFSNVIAETLFSTSAFAQVLRTYNPTLSVSNTQTNPAADGASSPVIDWSINSASSGNWNAQQGDSSAYFASSTGNAAAASNWLLGVGYTGSTNYWYGFNGATQTNYYTYTSSSTDSPTSSLYLGLGAAWGTDTGSTQGVSANITLSYTWVRARAYPPNEVMPSVTFGNIQTVTQSTITIYPTNTGLLYFKGEVYNTTSSAVTFKINNPDGSNAYSLEVPANSPPETFEFYSPNWEINFQYVFAFTNNVTFNYFFCRETY